MYRLGVVYGGGVDATFPIRPSVTCEVPGTGASKERCRGASGSRV